MMQQLQDNERWNRALIYGWGLSGRAAAELMACQGTSILAVDDAVLPEPIELPMAFEARLAGDLEQLPADVDVVVPSPGVAVSRPLLQQARALGVPILGELEIGARAVQGDLVAITGSNGKSTTTELTGALLRGAGLEVEVCGNIGTPLSARTAGSADRVFVVEVSSFQLETTDRFHPRVAALLNLSPDHLDRHGTLSEYGAIKQRIFARQVAGDAAVLNLDDHRVAASELPPGVRRRLFSRLQRVDDGAHLVGQDEDRIVVLEPGGHQVVRLADLRLRGEHNAENVLAACAIVDAYLAGRQREDLAAALEQFEGLPHRLQLVLSAAGVDWYDDSKGTNVGATLKSLAGFANGTVHLILGGQAKGAEFDELRPAVAEKVKQLYLIGEAQGRIEGALGGAAPLIRCETLERAVRHAARQVLPGDVVLLSPACASFDQFRNYAHRGEVFAGLVAEFAGRPSTPGGATDG